MVNNGEAKAGRTYAKIPPCLEYALVERGRGGCEGIPDLVGWPVRWSGGGWQGDVC
jgi:DNA-binding HxlR family transcriptional regulator